MAGFWKVLHQIHIAIEATRESGTVFGPALGTNHKGVEFTTELKRDNARCNIEEKPHSAHRVSRILKRASTYAPGDPKRGSKAICVVSCAPIYF